jgi:hypothetical protein
MGSTSQRRRSAGVVLLAIAFALTVASAPVAAAPPIEPEDFPLGLCTEKIEGAAQIEPLNPNTSDYVVWRCSQYDSQDLYHWKIDDFGTANEKLGELDAMETLKWVRDGVFIGLIGEGFGVLDADGVHSNGNLDFVGSFDLRGPNGSPLNRDHRRPASGAPFQQRRAGYTACSDTGWKQAPTSGYKAFYELQYGNGPKCGNGYYKLWTAGRFKSVATGDWVTSPWDQGNPIRLPIDGIPNN